MSGSCGPSRRRSSAATTRASSSPPSAPSSSAGLDARAAPPAHRLIGRPISSEREEHERLTKVKGLAIFSSDNISSSAYGPEEIMHVLVLAGTGALTLTLPLAGLITVMLAIVTVSYRQTIKAYPKGASSYIVASDNLGSTMGVLAAAALLIGYVVTVAVSVSAGVAAMTSLIPELFDCRVLDQRRARRCCSCSATFAAFASRARSS